MLLRAALVTLAFAGAAGITACATNTAAPATPVPPPSSIEASTISRDLDAVFNDPILSRALVGVHIESLRDGRTIYSRNAGARVIPASSLKIVTAAVAAERLGWDHRFETRLEISGTVVDGVLHGNVIVVGGGDPTIGARDFAGGPLFEEWAAALREAGITGVSGSIIGDDNAFDDEPLGAGWAWDYLADGYAAPSGALSYNENVVVLRVAPADAPGAPARVEFGPPGHGLLLSNHVATGAAGTTASLSVQRAPGSRVVTVTGQIPAGGNPIIRTTAVVNPTQFFAEGFRLLLASRGIGVRMGAADIDDEPGIDSQLRRRTLATHLSEPLSAITAHMMKVSQNFYGEMLIKALGRSPTQPGSTERGRQVVRATLESWGMPADALVMYDGSGLSRYNYVTAELLVGVLRRVWHDERLRGPFATALPVAGHDGTLGARMTEALRRRVQAKTGTISNVRSLAGYLETNAGEKLAFTMIANHFVAQNAQVDALMERALERVIASP